MSIINAFNSAFKWSFYPINQIHPIIKIGLIIPMSIPPSWKSDCCIFPVEKAIALGGVETGNSKALEAESPIIKANSLKCSGKMRTAIGSKIVVVAVFDIILDNMMVKKLKVK